MKLTQDTYDQLYTEWIIRHPESDHFVLICNNCYLIAQPGHDCAEVGCDDD